MHECEELRQFSEWISIGDGMIGGPNDRCADIVIPDNILLKASKDPIASIAESTFPSLGNTIDNPTFLEKTKREQYWHQLLMLWILK